MDRKERIVVVYLRPKKDGQKQQRAACYRDILQVLNHPLGKFGNLKLQIVFISNRFMSDNDEATELQLEVSGLFWKRPLSTTNTPGRLVNAIQKIDPLPGHCEQQHFPYSFFLLFFFFLLFPCCSATTDANACAVCFGMPSTSLAASLPSIRPLTLSLFFGSPFSLSGSLSGSWWTVHCRIVAVGPLFKR